jgi:hypothetical protein
VTLGFQAGKFADSLDLLGNAVGDFSQITFESPSRLLEITIDRPKYLGLDGVMPPTLLLRVKYLNRQLSSHAFSKVLAHNSGHVQHGLRAVSYGGVERH